MSKIPFTSKQLNEISVWRYFIPTNCDWGEENDADKIKFFGWSERGLHKDLTGIPSYKPEGRTFFHALYWGKIWAYRSVHELYEGAILDGTVPYYSILGGHEGEDITPRCVVNFLKKEMFKGLDSETIEECYQQILKEKTGECF